MVARVSLKVKIIGAFLISAVAVVGISLLNIQAIQQTRVSFTQLAENQLPRLEILQNMRVIATRLDKEALLYELSDTSTGGSTEAELQKNRLLADLDKLTDQLKDYERLINQSEVVNDASGLDAQFIALSNAKNETVNDVFELISLKEQRSSASIIETKEVELTETVNQLGTTISSLVQQDIATIDTARVENSKQVRTVAIYALIGSIVASAFAISVGLAISLSVARNINKLKVGSTRLARGDFRSKIQVDSRDELGDLAQSFNAMSQSLHDSYRRLALEKQRDETLLKSMNEGMVALDETGTVVLINPVAASLLQLNNDATQFSFSETVTLLDQKGTAVPPEQLPTHTLKTGKISESIYTFKDKNYKKLLNITASPIVIEDRVAGAILMIRNVTKEVEVDRMKTEFISLASHQLRTPLSAIKWFSEMLLNGDAGALNDTQKDFTKNIADSTDRMVKLVSALLNISRIESGRIIVDPKPTDIKELIEGIINDLKAKTEERHQSLIISIHDELPKINLDARLISQVYMNLLTNAIKYTPEHGEIVVMVSRKGDEIVSQITDTGYGIPKAQQHRVFEKFFRAENITKFETDGTGLGLYLIKSIVQSSGGKIWFKSEEGKGTTFWFTIPVSGMKAKDGEVTIDA